MSGRSASDGTDRDQVLVRLSCLATGPEPDHRLGPVACRMSSRHRLEVFRGGMVEHERGGPRLQDPLHDPSPTAVAEGARQPETFGA